MKTKVFVSLALMSLLIAGCAMTKGQILQKKITGGNQSLKVVDLDDMDFSQLWEKTKHGTIYITSGKKIAACYRGSLLSTQEDVLYNAAAHVMVDAGLEMALTTLTGKEIWKCGQSIHGSIKYPEGFENDPHEKRFCKVMYVS